MDALDRLVRRLVHNISSSYPEYLSRPFEVAELYQVLVPYRLNRRELELETNGDYEFAVTQLLAGERGYLVGDAEMQEALKREVASPNPDTGAFRRFANAQVALSPEILRRLGPRREAASAPGGGPSGPIAPGIPGGPGGPGGAETATDVMVPMREMPPGGIPFDTAEASAPDYASAPPRPPEPPAAAPGPEAGVEGPRRILRPFTVAESRGQSGAPNSPGAAAPSAPRAAPAPPPPARPASRAGAPPSPQEESMPNSRPTKTIMGGGPCPYCGGALPDGRRITFCPHCGHNLTVQYCPACSTELEPEWKFCTTCGREQAGAEALAGR